MPVGNMAYSAMKAGASREPSERRFAPVLEGREAYRPLIRLNQSEGIIKIREKFGRQHPYCGVRRILIELEAEPAKAQECAQKYADLVDDLAGILSKELGVRKSAWEKVFGPGKRLQARFFAEVWSLMKSGLGLVYGRNRSDTLHESLELRENGTREWDCDNGSFLVFDVGRKLGLRMDFIFAHNSLLNLETMEQWTEGHVLVKSRSFSFETTSGKHYPSREIWAQYPFLEGITRNMEAAQSATYNGMGNAKRMHGDWEGAISDYEMALRLNPALTVARLNLCSAKKRFAENNYFIYFEKKQD